METNPWNHILTSIFSGPWGKNKPAKLLERLSASSADDAWSDDDTRDFEALMDASIRDAGLAKQTLSLIENKVHDPEKVVAALIMHLDTYPDNLDLLLSMGALSERTRNLDYLNDPPDEIVLPRLIAALQAHNNSTLSNDVQEQLWESLATASRMAGRAFDDLAEHSCRKVLKIRPDFPPHLYTFGLFLKTRGRFAEGAEVYNKVLDIDAEPPEGYLWNLGICATGARQPELAMQAWSKLGMDLEIGAFDLPEMQLANVKVRLAEHPLAERAGRTDEPGLEETIWIERLGPCHGVIRSVLYQDLGIDYGDLVLFDGAPITYHKYSDSEVPVFPHLGTLERRHFQMFDFVATQPEPRYIDAVNLELPPDIAVYVHSETTAAVCRSCWEDQNRDQHHHSDENMNVVSGRIAAPASVHPTELLDMLDVQLANLGGGRLFSAALCEAAGDHDRAKFATEKAALLGQGETP